MAKTLPGFPVLNFFMTVIAETFPCIHCALGVETTHWVCFRQNHATLELFTKKCEVLN